MNTKIKLIPVNVGNTFPASWDAEFTQKPKTGEIETKKAKVEKFMNNDKKLQVARQGKSSRFVLVFKWKRINDNPVKYKLKISLRSDKRFRSDDGNQTPPIPKSPPPPPQ